MTFALLPISGLELSALVVVIFGVLVLSGLSETLGWTFSGLVVPGYLAALLVVSPLAGCAVLIEAILTVLLERVLVGLLAGTGVWTRFFGRERFLMLLVLSVIVRQSAELWILPGGLAWLDLRFGTTLALDGDVHSVGLVLVPLTANALSKDSVRAGFLQVFVPTLVTWFVLDRVLLGYTTLSLGSMALTYEDVSLDFLASARSYVLLIAGALVASRFNGVLGWSAGGILIPALLALAWYDPSRLVATFAESTAAVMVFRTLVRRPWVRDWNLEGTRKLTLLLLIVAFFRIGAAWARAAGVPLPQQNMGGLGYILSSLIALKVIQFRSYSSVYLPALFSSALAFILGSTAAWSIDQFVSPIPNMAPQADTVVSRRILESVDGVIAFAQVRARLDPDRSPSPEPGAAALAASDRLYRAVARELGAARAAVRSTGATGTAFGVAIRAALPDALVLDEPAGRLLGGRPVWVLRDVGEQVDDLLGWDTVVLRPGAGGPVLDVASPWRGAGPPGELLDAVTTQCRAADCQAIVMSGVDFENSVGTLHRAALAALEAEGVEVQPLVTRHADPVAEARVPSGRSWGAPGLSVVGFIQDCLTIRRRRWQPSQTESLWMTEAVAPALTRWSTGALSQEEVRHRAALVGYSVVELQDEGELLGLVPSQSAPVVIVRRGPSAPVMVQVPHPREEVGTVRLGSLFFTALDARVMLVDPMDKSAPINGVRSAMHSLQLGLGRDLFEPAAGAIADADAMDLIIRGFARGKEPRPEQDVVIGAGRPVVVAPPAALAGLLDAGRLAGRWSVRWAADNADEHDLTGQHLPATRLDLAFGRVTPGVLWFSDTSRAAWQTDARRTADVWFGAAGLSLEERDPAAPLAASRPVSSQGAEVLEHLGNLALRAMRQHNLNLLRLLMESATRETLPGVRTVAVSAGWDPHMEISFIELRVEEPADAVAARRYWLLPGPVPSVNVTDPASRGRIRAALRWGPADLLLAGGVR